MGVGLALTPGSLMESRNSPGLGLGSGFQEQLHGGAMPVNFWVVFLFFPKHSVKFGLTPSLCFEMSLRLRLIKPVSLIEMVWGPQIRWLKVNYRVLISSSSEQGKLSGSGE